MQAKPRRIVKCVLLGSIFGVASLLCTPRITHADQYVTFAFTCLAGVLLLDREDIKYVAIVQRSEQWVSLGVEFSDDAAEKLSRLTQQSIGQVCHFYGNGTLISSAVVQSPIFNGGMVVQMSDVDLADRLVEGFHAQTDRTGIE